MAASSNIYVKCPNYKSYDRFIPYRRMLDVEAAYAQIRSSWERGQDEPVQYISANTRQYWKLLGEGHRQNGKILPIGSNSMRDRKSGCSPLKDPFSAFTSPEKICRSSPGRGRRARVPTSPDRIMDMPGLLDDFYTNNLDWSKLNILAVALNQTTYVWFVDSMAYKKFEMEPLLPDQSYISALTWSPSDPFLAVANNHGEISVCNIELGESKMMVEKKRQCSAVGALQWTEHGIISGNAKGIITIYDLRSNHSSKPRKLVGGQGCEIIGLRQAPGSQYLASGGEGGAVNIWDLRTNTVSTAIDAHCACAKALAWCPYKSGVLATGGGSTDGHIRLWQTHTGEKLGEVFTQSQICGLLWSRDYMELVSSHGTPVPEKNDLVLWNMKNLEFEPLSVLRQHLARPLHMALSPDDTMVASVGADEALCLWNVFPKKCQRQAWNNSALNLFKMIR